MSVNSFNASNPPLTTKGDLYGFSTVPTRVPVGTNGQVLTADSTATNGVAWAAAAGGSLTLISTTALTGTTVSLTSIPSTYRDIQLRFTDFYHSQGAGNTRQLELQVNSTGGIYAGAGSNSASSNAPGTAASMTVANSVEGTASDNICIFTIFNYKNTTANKVTNSLSFNLTATTPAYNLTNTRGAILTTSAISSIQITYDAFNHQAGTVELWGIN